jgi:asparagine synthase (glutamine-hydrolysing)
MCGVVGIFSNLRNVENAISSMNIAQKHRGPNSDGTFVFDNLGLGHVRLSILDLSDAASQPMHFNELTLVFNGELYNFASVRDELVAEGYSFTSSSDTEVLLKAWHRWGAASLPKFNGMFAFAIFDKNKRQVTVCRDQFGVKPLHYYFDGKEFLFASEVSTISTLLKTQLRMSKEAVANYLALQFVPGSDTGLEGISRLLPGHSITFSFNNSSLNLETCSWQSINTPDLSNVSPGEADIDQLINRATQDQLVSDVPVGSFLSGGVDSSLLTWFASRGRNLHTFSVGFSDVSEEHDETRFAKRAAEICQTTHHPVQVELAHIDDIIFENLNILEELNADTSIFLNDIVCKEAAKYVKVCLSGAGGDELFGGYYRHQALLALKLLDKIPNIALTPLNKILGSMPQHRDTTIGNLVRRLSHFFQLAGSKSSFLEMLRNDNKFRQTTNFLGSHNNIKELSDALEFDMRYFLCDNIFAFTDRVSMKHGLEVRVPFMDPDLISAARRLPDNQKTTLFQKKVLLKKITANYFPKDLVYRKKQGFSAPLEIWMRKYSKKQLEDMCFDGVTSTILGNDLIRNLVNSFVDKKQDLSTQIYSFIALNHWAKNHHCEN